MKKLIFLKSVFALFVIALTSQSCLKDDLAAISEPEPEIKVETVLNLSDDFSWKTTQDLELSVKPNSSSVLYIKTADDKVYYKQVMKSGKEEKIPLTIPAFEQELIVELNGQQKTLDLSLGEFEVNYN